MASPEPKYESVVDGLIKQAAWVVVFTGIFWALGELFRFFFRMALGLVSLLNSAAANTYGMVRARNRRINDSRVRIPEVEQQPVQPKAEPFDPATLFPKEITTTAKRYSPSSKFLT